jgi:hypothetical protein
VIYLQLVLHLGLTIVGRGTAVFCLICHRFVISVLGHLSGLQGSSGH